MNRAGRNEFLLLFRFNTRLKVKNRELTRLPGILPYSKPTSTLIIRVNRVVKEFDLWFRFR